MQFRQATLVSDRLAVDDGKNPVAEVVPIGARNQRRSSYKITQSIPVKVILIFAITMFGSTVGFFGRLSYDFYFHHFENQINTPIGVLVSTYEVNSRKINAKTFRLFLQKIPEYRPVWVQGRFSRHAAAAKWRKRQQNDNTLRLYIGGSCDTAFETKMI